MKLISFQEEGQLKKYWRYAVFCGRDKEGYVNWFPAPEIFNSKEQAIKEAAETYPNRNLIAGDGEL